MRLQDLLGIDLPVIQAPMAGSQGSALALAVSQVGALGSLPCAMLTPQALEREYQLVRAGTDKPLNLNFFCHTPPDPSEQREAAWRMALEPYYRELGLSMTNIAPGAARSPFKEDMARMVEQLGPAVVSFHFGLPSESLLERVKRAGAKVLSSATTLAEARWLEARGVDAVIAQGNEAGGHRGMFLSDDVTTQLGTLALVSQLTRALRVPVIAAGGIASAREVAAAQALGAAGVQVGTAYLFTPEATLSQVHRSALHSDGIAHTALTNLFSGRPARGIVNRLMRELGALSTKPAAFPLAAGAVAPLRAKAESLGRGDFSPLWCGQNAAGCVDRPASELTQELASGWH
jgi:nitronate monooxygenase